MNDFEDGIDLSYDSEHVPVPREEATRIIESSKELNHVATLLDDDDVFQVLAYVVTLIEKPDIPAVTATPLINKLQALSFKFKIAARAYMTENMNTKANRDKKNLFETLSDQSDKLAAALKYTVRHY